MARFQRAEVVEAREHCEEALTLARQCSRADVIARIFYGLATLDAYQGQHESALVNACQALDLFRRLGMKREQAAAEALLRQIGEQL